MKRLTVLALATLIGAGTLSAQAPAKRRIAVLDFDYATVHQYVYDAFGSDQDIGKGIADMLVTNLVRNGTYSVIERKQLDQVLREQNFQQSGRADPSSAVQLARLLGVDAIIIGSITQFGRDDKKLGVGGGVRVGGIGLGGLGKKSAKAVVVIDARIVSTTTAEILGVATGHGESKRSGLTVAGGAAVGGVAAGGVLDMSSSNFANTILGEATRAAVDSLTSELVGSASRIQETKVEIRALVADVSGGEVIINVGTGAGVRVGSEYDITRPGREIKDPATGRVLRRTTTPVGKLKITSADEGSATGTLTGGPARVGDCVGTCPTNVGGGGGAAPSAVEPLNQSNAPAPPRSGGALPALYSAPITGAFRLRLGLIDRQRASAQFIAMEALDRGLRVPALRHLNKAKPTGLTGKLIGEDVSRRHRTRLAEQIFQVRSGRIKLNQLGSIHIFLACSEGLHIDHTLREPAAIGFVCHAQIGVGSAFHLHGRLMLGDLNCFSPGCCA